ncbi:MAG: histidine phosphatase family protein [Pseudomonadota bacterium]
MPSLAAPLVFLRHGETDWNRQRLFQGSKDIVLNGTGQNQARAHAAPLSYLLSEGVLERRQITLHSSPLQRARQTAEILRDALSLPSPVQCHTGLREISMGDWEGMTTESLRENHFALRKQRRADRWHFTPPNGESMASRAEEIIKTARRLPPHSIVVTHSVVLRILLQHINGGDKNAASRQNIPHEGAWLFDGEKMRHHSA